MKIIIIDDDILAVNMLLQTLKKNSFITEEPLLFTDSEEACEYIKHNHVDVVISDIYMPSPTGIELAEYCRDYFSSIKFILISAYRDFSYAQSAISIGNVVSYLTKPIDMTQLITTLKSINVENQLENHSFAPINDLNKYSEVFIDLLCGSITTKDQLRSEISSVIPDINIDDMSCVLINFHINNISDYIKAGRQNTHTKIYSAIRSLAPFETETAYFILTRSAYSNIEWMVVYKNSGDTNIAEEFSKSLIKNTSELFDIDMNVTSRTAYSRLADLIKPATFTDNGSDERIRQAMDYINLHYSENITLTDVANYVYMTPSYLSAYIKKVTGKKFIDILTEVRMKKTTELLNSGKYSINAICDMVGYSNIGHFYKIFKKYYNTTPNEYMKNK